MSHKLKLFTIFLLLYVGKIHAQGAEHIDSLLSDKKLLLETTNNVIRIAKNSIKKKKLPPLDSLVFYYVYSFRYKGDFQKEEFYSNRFLTKLSPIIRIRKHYEQKPFYDTRVTAVGKDGKYYGSLNGLITDKTLFSIGNNSDYEKQLLTFQKGKKFDYIIYIALTDIEYLVGLKGENAFVIDLFSKPCKVTPIKEFVDCCWDKYVL